MNKFFARLQRWVSKHVNRRLKKILLPLKVNFNFRLRRAAKAHGLPSSLIVSLTSYPARFEKLPLTLKCLLSQSMAPDRVVLWVAYEDKKSLTPAILELQKAGLEIAYCEDVRSYKKIIPSLQNYPDSFIVTADDDLYYWSTWLEELVRCYKANPGHVIAHRIHRIRLASDNLPLPYSAWDTKTNQLDPSPLNFQTGVGGVLYPPHILHPSVLNVEQFRSLCPMADDVWLYWMMRLQGVTAIRVPEVQYRIYTWPGTQRTALYHTNLDEGQNDVQIKAMINAYGLPY